jgi:hypothetical protein
MTEDRQWFNVGAVKLPEAERDVARAVFTEAPERFYDIMGADTPEDHERYPIGSHTAYSAHLTEREAEQFSRASNLRYIEPNQRHYSVTCSTNAYLPRPDAQRYTQSEIDAYPTLTGINIPIADIDEGNTSLARAVKNVTLLSKAFFVDDEPLGEIYSAAADHGCLTMGQAVPQDGWVIDAVAIDGNDTTTDAYMASAITWVLGQGAQLVNMSLTLGAYSTVVNDALVSANTQDVAFFIAAGNDGQRIQRWPSSANTYMPYVHAVMSVDMSLNQRSSFTNYGPWQTGMAPGELVYTTDWDGSISGFIGTSAATPHALQLAARIMTAGVSAKQAAAALKATVRDIGVTDGQGAPLCVYSMSAALQWLGKEPPVVITRPGRPQNPGLPLW